MRLTHSPDPSMMYRMTDQIDRSTDVQTSVEACIPNPDEYPTISVSVAARIAGVARRTGYAAAQRGEWPVVRTGRAVRIRTRQFLVQCGFAEGAQ
jgi:hypothetical protein